MSVFTSSKSLPFIIAHITLLLIVIHISSAKTIYQKIFYKVSIGGPLQDGDVLSTAYVQTAVDCSSTCLSVPRCIAFNYKYASQRSRNCQLTNKTRDKIIAEKGNWTFYQDLNILRNESQDDNAKTFPVVKSNCADLYDSGERDDGVYTIDPDGQGSLQVWCDMTTAGGGWTVIQRRVDGSVDFYLDWSQYKTGFGNLSGEFWLGLDKIYRLTQSGLNVLRIDLMDFSNNQVYARYQTFEISNEDTQYTLKVAGFSGNAGDSLDYHNGQKFSTKDQDATGNCAKNRKGAWWYKACAWSNLNGQYLGPGNDEWHGIQWRFWKNTNECMKTADMKLRPQQ